MLVPESFLLSKYLPLSGAAASELTTKGIPRTSSTRYFLKGVCARRGVLGHVPGLILHFIWSVSAHSWPTWTSLFCFISSVQIVLTPHLIASSFSLFSVYSNVILSPCHSLCIHCHFAPHSGSLWFSLSSNKTIYLALSAEFTFYEGRNFDYFALCYIPNT
jgi:hypothetical protein